jgi:hypothetical protein
VSDGRGGAAAIIAGVAVIAPVLLSELAGRDPFTLLPVSLIILVFGLSGLRKAQAGRDGQVGKIGYFLAAGGASLLTIMLLVRTYNQVVLNTQLQGGLFLFIAGFFALVIGVLAMGASMLNAKVLHRIAAIVFMLALPLGLIIRQISAPGGSGVRIDGGVGLGIKIFGLGLVWLGYGIISAKSEAVRNA